MGQLLCQERLGTLPKISGVKIPRCRVPKSFLSKLHLISCQTCICNPLYYFLKFPFLSFVLIVCFISLTCLCFLQCKNVHTYISDWTFFPHSHTETWHNGQIYQSYAYLQVKHKNTVPEFHQQSRPADSFFKFHRSGVNFFI